MLIVTVLEKGGAPKRLEFTKSEIVIGRTPDNDLPLPKGNVSKRQCRLNVTEDKKITLTDLKSTCGTYVNRHKVSVGTFPVLPDDKIYIGDFILTAEYQQSSDAQSKMPAIQFEAPPGPKLEGVSVFSPIQLSHHSVIASSQ